jgi:spore germination protein YaaH
LSSRYTILKEILPIILILGLFPIITVCSSVPEEAGIEIESVEEEEFQEEAEDVSMYLPPGENLPVSTFGEVWGYVISGREEAFRSGMPLTDIGYFGAMTDFYGKLVDVPNPKNIRGFKGRVHLVVTCNSNSLTHFVLVPGSAERKTLIADLIAATRNFDGLQIDFENIPKRDGGTFRSFLAELREGLPDKVFTVALPARTRTLDNDIFDYTRIKPLVDRILVMAYDEHWSTSAPGPIASMRWCRNVAEYSLKVIGPEKLVMGLPFYGRAWGHINPSKAYLYSGIERVLRENETSEITRENGIPTFDYDVKVSVKVYYEDDYSLSARMEMYRAMGARAVGFWRVGQEIPSVWDLIQLDE